MNFKFYPKESKIYDFLKFPRLLFYREESKKREMENNYEGLVIDDYLDFVKDVEERLTVLREDIQKFYGASFLYEYDFIDLITQSHGICNTIYGYEDERDYLKSLLELSKEEISRNLIYSLIQINEEYLNDNEDVMERARDISGNKDHMISFIKELSIEASSKWNLFLIVEDPKGHMKSYIDLMMEILPIFNRVYEIYEEEILSYGKKLESFLNENGEEGLKNISYSMIDSKLIENQDIKLIVSKVYSYAVSMFNVKEDSYVVWGFKMEETFKKMKEIDENKTQGRVQIFKNLGDKTRYETLKLIAQGQSSTTEIAKKLGVSTATISYHINNFLTTKVIKLDKRDKRYGYTIDYELLSKVIEGLKEDLLFPNP